MQFFTWWAFAKKNSLFLKKSNVRFLKKQAVFFRKRFPCQKMHIYTFLNEYICKTVASPPPAVLHVRAGPVSVNFLKKNSKNYNLQK